MRGVWSGLWLWLLVIVLLTMVSCSANHHRHDHKNKPDHEWRGVPVQGMPDFREQVWRPSLFNGDIFLAKERSTKLGIVESVNSWINWAADRVSGAVRHSYAYLEDLAQARHEFYTKLWQQIVPSRSSVPFGNPGATEPLAAIIPRPPTLSHGYGMKAKMSLIMSHVLRKYFLTTITCSEDASCYDVMNDQLMVFRRMLKDQIQSALCKTSHKSGCTQKFCNLLDTNSDMAVDMVFARLKINQGEAVTAHMRNLKCKGKHWKRNTLHVLKLGSDFRRNVWERQSRLPPMLNMERMNADEALSSANYMVNQLCEKSTCPNVRQACSVRRHNEKLFNTLFMSKLQPWDLPASPSFKPLDLPTLISLRPFDLPAMPMLRPLDLPARPYYRRAMIFRGPTNVHIVESGLNLGTFENIDVHFFERIKNVFKVNDVINNNPDKVIKEVKEEGTSMIKMATENPRAAAI